MSPGNARPIESASAMPAILAQRMEGASRPDAPRTMTDAVDSLCEALQPAVNALTGAVNRLCEANGPTAAAPVTVPTTCPVLVRVARSDRKRRG